MITWDLRTTIWSVWCRPSGVYPIATANDKDQISAPLMSRFAVIDIPDYTDGREEDHFLQICPAKGAETD